MDLVVNGVYCGACIVTIEKGLGRQAGVRGARVNLASRRVTVEWNDGALEPPVILERLEALGYPRLSVHRRGGRQRRGAGGEAAPALSRRRRVRRDERHAAVGLAVGGRRIRPELRHARPVPLALGAGRAAVRGLRRHAVLRKRRALHPGRRAQHGRPDLARRHSGARDVDAADGDASARRLFRERRHAADVPARRAPARPAHAAAHPRLRRQPVGDAGRPRGEALRRRRGARDADRRDCARRPRARPPRRADRRRRDGRGGALGGRPEPRDRRDRPGARRGRRGGLRRHAQPDRRLAHPRAARRRRDLPRRGQRPHRQRGRAAFGLRPPRRPRRAALRAGRPRDRARDLRRLARARRRLAAGRHDRDHRADHHLPLRPRPRRSRRCRRWRPGRCSGAG